MSTLTKNPYVIGGVAVAALLVFMATRSKGGNSGAALMSQSMAESNSLAMANVQAGTIYASANAQTVLGTLKSLENLSNISARQSVAMFDIQAGITKTRMNNDNAFQMTQVIQSAGIAKTHDANQTSISIADINANASIINTQANANAAIVKAAYQMKADKEKAKWGFASNLVQGATRVAAIAL